MTAQQRIALLDSHISAEARRIAHAAIKCGKTDQVGDAWHSAACNRLKREIENFALNVKRAAAQQSLEPGQQHE